MRIFINNVDGYVANALCADLWKLSHGHIIGTRKGQSIELIPPVVKRIVPRIEPRKLLKAIAACDVIIYDLHDADLEELEFVLRAFHNSQAGHDVTFVLVSSVGTWARTQRNYEEVPVPEPEEPEEVEEPPPAPVAETPAKGEKPTPRTAAKAGAKGKPTPPPTPPPEEEEKEPEEPPPPKLRPTTLTHKDYDRRVPAPKWQEWKTIETLVLALKEKERFTPYVICSGLPYGNGEEPLLGVFKAAWKTKPSLRIIGSGDNFIPCIHVRDVARLVRRVIEVKPEVDYHIAVDRSDVTQRRLLQNVVGEFASESAAEIPAITAPEAVLAEFADVLTMDLRLECSPLMEDEETFRWWCKQGLADRENVATVVSEFTKWRRLQPLRFVLIGPPGSGTAALTGLLTERYNLPEISYEKALEAAQAAEGPFGDQLREKLDEIAVALSNPKSPGPFNLPSNMITQVVDEAVKKNKVAKYRGFVLSGFPVTVEEATMLFLEDPPPPPPAETPVEGEEGTEGAGEVSATPPVEDTGPPEQIVRALVAPDLVVALSCADDAYLLERYKGERPNSEKDLDKEFKLAIDRWKKENTEESSAVVEFFREKLQTEPLLIATDKSEEGTEVDFEDIVDDIAAALTEKRGCIRNFLLPPLPRVKHEEVGEEDLEELPEEDEVHRREQEAQRRAKEEAERLETIRREEFTRLEKHSEPLRQYLMTFVVPTLTSGLIEICREMPEDPIDYLSEFLFAFATEPDARPHAPEREAGALTSASTSSAL